MFRLLLLTLVLSLSSCENDLKIKELVIPKSKHKKNKISNTIIEKKDLIVTKNGTFKEYYPGKKRIKFEGTQDKEGKRHGKWQFFSESGIELSMTMYNHGEKHGLSIVKYPNGNLHYTGEYSNNNKIGIWRTYSTKGKMINEINYKKL